VGQHAELSQQGIAGELPHVSPWADAPAPGYCHQALHYRGREELLHHLAPFVREGMRLGQPMLVMVGGATLCALRDALGDAARAIELADVDQIGANPARIIPAWASFIERHAGDGPLRGVVEAVGAARPSDVVLEALFHEDLLNVAVEPDVPLWLLCPYDTAALDADVVRTSLRSHPFVCDGTAHRASDAYLGRRSLGRPAGAPLPAPPRGGRRFSVVGAGALASARRQLAIAAVDVGMGRRTDEVLLAADEVLSNSIRHGGGVAQMVVWDDGCALYCEVADRGELTDPLAGRRRPHPDATGGRGLWIANQLCDLVQVRAVPGGTIVRLVWRRDR
jgi:anti-sigma regulatory factor (Ser/Thr protein kinase)